MSKKQSQFGFMLIEAVIAIGVLGITVFLVLALVPSLISAKRICDSDAIRSIVSRLEYCIQEEHSFDDVQSKLKEGPLVWYWENQELKHEKPNSKHYITIQLSKDDSIFYPELHEAWCIPLKIQITEPSYFDYSYTIAKIR